MALEETRAMLSQRGFNTLAVVVIALWGLFVTQEDYLLPWFPYASFGIVTDFDGNITDVQPDGDAARAGIVPGDRVNMAVAGPDVRRYNLSIAAPPTGGITVMYPIEHKGTTRWVRLTSVTRTRSLADNISNAVETFAVLVSIVIGAALVLLRPSVMTWSFYFVVMSSIGYSIFLFSRLPMSIVAVNLAVAAVFLALGTVGMLVFAARFPGNHAVGWRAWIDRYVWLLAPILVGFDEWWLIGHFLGIPSNRLAQDSTDISYVVYGVALVLFIDAFRAATAEQRQRMRWVIAGMVVWVSGFTANDFIFGFGLLPPSLVWLNNVIFTLPVVIPLTVAYALIKSRVVDVNFAISRALVYGLITGFIIAVFGILDWIFGRVLATTQWAVPAELLVAIGLGFWLNGLEKRVDRVVDGILFRKRYLAEVRLERVAKTLPHSPTFEVADEFLIREPVDALELTSAAVFRRDDNGAFARVASIGWAEADLRSLGAIDSLVLQLIATEAPLRMREVIWPHADLPKNEARPVIALPMSVRHQLTGFALYAPTGRGRTSTTMRHVRYERSPRPPRRHTITSKQKYCAQECGISRPRWTHIKGPYAPPACHRSTASR